VLKQLIGRLVLKLMGWKVAGEAPTAPKHISIAAHHTTNWDFVIGLAVTWTTSYKVNLLAKHTLFWWPFSIFLRSIGGVPINRKSPKNIVEQLLHQFDSHERFALAISPEGTRKPTDYWKSGFYRIALKAQVPIALGFLDYKRKVAGWGETIELHGDPKRDMRVLREFYKGVSGKYPEKQGTVRLREEDAAQTRKY